MQIVTLILMADFIGYWSHRLRHSNRYLWAFHTIHHSQTMLTVVTNYRFHYRRRDRVATLPVHPVPDPRHRHRRVAVGSTSSWRGFSCCSIRNGIGRTDVSVGSSSARPSTASTTPRMNGCTTAISQCCSRFGMTSSAPPKGRRRRLPSMAWSEIRFRRPCSDSSSIRSSQSHASFAAPRRVPHPLRLPSAALSE